MHQSADEEAQESRLEMKEALTQEIKAMEQRLLKALESRGNNG